MAADQNQPSSTGQAWFCTTGLPSDIVVQVVDMTFHLHKFPLMSKSRKLHRLIADYETTIPAKESTEDDGAGIEEVEPCHVSLPDFPGGSQAFEMAAKFCYGVNMDFTALNAAPLRCAGEFLEMTDDYCEGNLVSRTEKFLSESVLKSLEESIKALKSCERLMPLAETLGIAQRCIDSIASSADPALSGLETGGRRKGSLFEGIAHLSLPLFERLILAMRAGDLSPEIVETCLMCYAKKHIPGVLRSSRKLSSSSSIASESEQRELLETIITNLPLQKSSRSTKILFGLLRTANILKAGEPYKAALEKKIGSLLDEATLDDLLIPSYSYLNETLYDVDCVERILGYFLEETRDGGENEASSQSLTRVGKLIDGYLSEIASDTNLKSEKFYSLAIALPEEARIFDDGLYRSVDVYLKAHPWISEAERERISGALDCQKLTLEACTHAAQNERLPLRAVVQVLFFEQLQLRHAIAAETVRPSVVEEESTMTWRAAARENEVLRLDMDSMRTRVKELERECLTMKKVVEGIEKAGPKRGWRGSLGRKLGCKLKTQVCDSQEAAVVDTRGGRYHHHQS